MLEMEIELEKREEMKEWYVRSRRVMRARRALNEVKWKFGIGIKEVKLILKEAFMAEDENRQAELIEKAKREKGVEWEDMLEKALTLFMEALYDGKDLNMTQKWAVDKVLEKTEKRRKKGTGAGDDPLGAFDGAEKS